MSTVCVEISSRTDDDSVDSPWVYTAQVLNGSMTDAEQMLLCELGGSEALEAFSIECEGTTLTFLSFNRVDIGTRFEIGNSVDAAKQAAKKRAETVNELERLTTRAFMELFPAKPIYLRGFWWERIHPDPDLRPLLDVNGNLIQVGLRCAFKSEQTGEWIEGWVKQIGSHSERPVGVWEMGRVSNFGTGCHPENLRVVADVESAGAVVSAIKELIEARMASRDYVGLAQISEDPDMLRMTASLLSGNSQVAHPALAPALPT
ncbi:hypothetical protein [Pseudomonas sp. NPDC096950]|uniref:hypothetical protein n=1 Tax=Pseudomonas sp. NPDC096950 TaxID=3364485 RepID=UPI00383B6CEF